MARHFVAVCVVCLLCADHLPCKTHFEPLAASPYVSAGDYLNSDADFSQASIAGVGGDNVQLSQSPISHQEVQPHTRRKRHSVHPPAVVDEDAIHMNDNSRRYIEQIFERYGNGDAKTMNLDGFENMLEHLGLTNLLLREEVLQAEQHQGKSVDTRNESCLSSADFVTRISRSVEEAQPKSLATSKVAKREVGGTHRTPSLVNDLTEGGKSLGESVNETGASIRSATNASVIINGTSSNAMVDQARRALQIDTETLYNICPILVYHLTTPQNASCLKEVDILVPLGAHDHDEEHVGEKNDRALVWIYASVSVLGVSLCGMLGFAVIPCMDKSFYNTMLQFLVALAVGTLAGDALLHLLPHAMLLSIETAGPEGAHTAMTFKGLVAVLGVIAFFAIERGLTMIAEWRKERQKKQQLPGRVRVMRDPESVSLNNSEKQCKNKYSSYPYCYDEIAMDTKDDHHHHHQQQQGGHHGHSHNHSHNHGHSHEKKPSGTTISTTSMGIGQAFKPNSVLPLKSEESHLVAAFDHSQLSQHEQTVVPVMMTNNNGTHKSVSQMERLNSTGSNINNNTADNTTVSTTLDDGSSIESSRMLKPIKSEESYTVILREHESKHHGHSHTHGHVHSPPGSLSAVAWMVVMGDGLHNFTDGMAIGAAFSNDIAGGFSTAIAVFCHELPHELGDFAVLLKAGMSAKKAVYYNFLSSILSFFGMVLGICIGDTPEASAWIFAIAAGLFIYIALVDMVPELTSSHHENCAGSNTLLQVLGMSMGLVIMLLIALNEEDLKSLFSEHGRGHHNHHH